MNILVVAHMRKDGLVYPSAEHFFQAHKTLDVQWPGLHQVLGVGFGVEISPNMLLDMESVPTSACRTASKRISGGIPIRV